ncbi:hypothetical protein [Paraflavitalea speifideaquila]|uniref:hypothetical protein n=1 Tax=Paraflavitalea speifideaquila TaxID=3076558 RepID=UPI0028ED3952|nr:hypothetical protein [Paraflavitalea speifideiaquila]
MTTTNQDGYFSLKVSSGAIIIISNIGYESKELPAAANMDIVLTPNPPTWPMWR